MTEEMTLRPPLPLLFIGSLGVFAASALSGCSNEENLGDRDDEDAPLAADGIDLDEKNELWMADLNGKVAILYTYKNDASINMDVRETPKGSIAEQYTGARSGHYVFELSCVNSATCKTFVPQSTLICTAGGTKAKPQLVCDARIFRPVTADEISQ